MGLEILERRIVQTGQAVREQRRPAVGEKRGHELFGRHRALEDGGAPHRRRERHRHPHRLGPSCRTTIGVSTSQGVQRDLAALGTGIEDAHELGQKAPAIARRIETQSARDLRRRFGDGRDDDSAGWAATDRTQNAATIGRHRNGARSVISLDR